MATSNQQQIKEQLENLHAHLTLIQTMKDSEKENEYFVLLEKAQKILGDVSPHIAIFYYRYGCFVLSKIEKNMDLFNPDAVPEAQEEGFVDEYDECYDDDQFDDQNGANNYNTEKKEVNHHDEEKKQKVSQADVEKTQKPSNDTSHKKGNEKVLYEDDCMQIKEMDDKLKEKLQENPNFLQNGDNNDAHNDEEEDLTDIEFCYENFQAALNIYDQELKKIENGEESPLDRTEATKYKFRIHGRLGELYSMDQKYDESIEEFRTVVKLASDFDHPETLRIISEAHFSIGNALLHQNNSGCEELAIQEYISAVKCLIQQIYEVERYDTEKFQIPSLHKPRVDRYQYLRAPKDNEQVADLKEVISMILDKIEDTYEQIGVRAAYEAEKKKMEKEKQDSGFKEVPKDVKVTNLGTFGNRKRTPAENSQTADPTKILTGLNPNAPSSSLRNLTTSNQTNGVKGSQESGSKTEQIRTETEVKESKNQNNEVKVDSETKDATLGKGLFN